MTRDTLLKDILDLLALRLNMRVFNEIDETTSSDPISAATFKELTVSIKSSDTSTGSILTAYGSPVSDDEDFWAPLALIGADGIVRTEQEITHDGAHIFEIVNSSSIAFVKFTLTVTDGSYTLWLQAMGLK